MSLYNNIETRMEYIQRVFMKVQNYMQEDHHLDEIIAFLDSESKEFRSVTYESASMTIGLKDLSRGGQLNQWKKFCLLAKDSHSAHMKMGLGLAFGKAEISPTPYLKLLDLVLPWMVFDGIGYYYGLFKGRVTVKNHKVPDFIGGEDLHGFNQGLGRRLWYVARGEAKVVFDLIQSFASSRQSDLWRGVGMACAYVGGNDKNNLERLATYSAANKIQLSNGVVMAALNRILSANAIDDIDFTYSIILGKPLKDLKLFTDKIMKGLGNKSDILSSNWINKLEEEFVTKQ